MALVGYPVEASRLASQPWRSHENWLDRLE
jgi:hypothetical protein